MEVTTLAIVLMVVLGIVTVGGAIIKALTLGRVTDLDGLGGTLKSKEEYHDGKIITKGMVK